MDKLLEFENIEVDVRGSEGMTPLHYTRFEAPHTEEEFVNVSSVTSQWET